MNNLEKFLLKSTSNTHNGFLFNAELNHALENFFAVRIIHFVQLKSINSFRQPQTLFFVDTRQKLPTSI